MKRLLLLTGLIVCIALGQFAVQPIKSFAKSATWSDTFNNTTWYRTDYFHPVGGFEEYGNNPTLYNPHIEVTYSTTVTNADTGEVVQPNSCVPQGTKLTFAFTPHQSSDVYWFGTGYAWGTPYGEWRANAAPGPIACDAKDYVAEGNRPGEKLYIPFVVHPPAGKSLTSTTGLTCGASASDGTTNCVASGSGTVTPVFSLSDTFGAFYTRGYTNYNPDGPWDTWRCLGSNFPLSLDPAVAKAPVPLSTTRIDIPAQTIAYPICISAPGAAPTSPVVTVTPAACPSYTIALTATDPDGDRIRYGIDWDNNGTVNEWVPANGYVSSGQQQVITHTFPEGATSAFRVYAQDSGGMMSSSTSYTVTVPQCPVPPTVVLTSDITTLTLGQSTMLRWQASANADSCVGTGFSTGGLTAGSRPIAPALTTTYSISCTNAAGAGSDSETVTVLAPQCSDKIDNADPEDVLVDYPNDPGCTSPTDDDETDTPTTTQCSDGIDNTDPEDTLIDFGSDPGCTSTTDDDETDYPDLISQNLSIVGGATSVSVNTPVSFTATTKNSSLTSIGTAFSDRFQLSSNGGATWFTMTTPPATTGLAPNGTVPETGGFTPLTTGTYTIRHCADEPGNTVNEGANEGNNCTPPSQYVILTVTPSTGNPSALSCAVNPNPVDINTSARWSASVSGGNAPYTYRWSGEAIASAWSSDSFVDASYPTPGTKHATIEVQDSLGLPGGPIDCALLVPSTTLVVKPPPTVDLRVRNITTGGLFANSIAPITDGDQVELEWTSTNANSCTGVNFDTQGRTGNPTPARTGPTNEPTSAQPSSIIYTVVCNGVSDSVSVSLSSISTTGGVTITANPPRVRRGSTAQITPDAGPNTNCRIDGTNIDPTNLDGDGNPNTLLSFVNGTVYTTGPLNGQTDYVLSCPAPYTGTPAQSTVRIQEVIEET